METQAVEIIETEVPLEKVMSLNHARLTGRLCLLLSKYEEKYDILPELEFDLTTGRVKPDVSILPKQKYNWQEDIIYYPNPPITAVEVLSPTQSFDSLASKIVKVLLAGGTQSAWLLVPFIKTIHLFLPGQPVATFSTGTLHDPASGVDIELEALFQ
jgi:Uma2 family endonuclease